MNEDIAKMELIDKDISFILQKAKSKVEGERKGKVGCKEKTMKRLASEHWKLVVKKKEEKKFKLKIRKRNKKKNYR